MNEVITPTSPMEDFQNKLRQKVREDIANLLPEDAVAELVKKAIEEEFFKKEQENIGSSYNPRWRDKPSAFVHEVVKAAEPIMKEEVRKAVELCRPMLEQEIAKFVSAQNMTLIIATAIGQAMQANTYSVVQQLLNSMKNGY